MYHLVNHWTVIRTALCCLTGLIDLFSHIFHYVQINDDDDDDYREGISSLILTTLTAVVLFWDTVCGAVVIVN